MEQEQEISLQDIVKVLKKRWKLILLPAMTTAFLVAGISLMIPREYESYALLRPGCSGTKPLETASSLSEIMCALPNIQKIAKIENFPENKRIPRDLVKYEAKSDLIRISARAKTPEKAQELVATATVIVLERHHLLYDNAEKQMASIVKYVRETLQPVPLSSGINEFIVKPSVIEVAPVFDREPVRKNARMMVVLAFMAVLFMDVLLAFYLEGTEK